jgi:hypothetical protein
VRQFTARLARQTALPDRRIAGEFSAPGAPGHAPGQFYLGQARAAPSGYLRQPIFPEGDGWIFDLPPAWALLRPGDEIDLIGPCGRGWPTPEGTNVLLLAGPSGARRVLPLARLAVAQGAAAVLLCERPQPLGDLPAEVEVRFGLAGLPEALRWATSLYADAPDETLVQVRRTLRGGGWLGGSAAAYVFRLPITPCGVGACGACAAPARRGWKLACLDGPWFELEW